MSDYEFKCKAHDGFGDNWPIGYKDFAPYYDRVEPLFRVAGRREGFAQIPDGVFIADDSPDSECVRRFIASAKRMNVPTTKSREATGQFASSVNLLLPDALATGNLTIVPNSAVRKLAAVDMLTTSVREAPPIPVTFHFPARRSKSSLRKSAA